ncbi:MAG: hypothetical protein OEY59_12670 [Deltaproteobacteria bacterium]|nr:hypothetical protein [Deltaproteobacteria bacterium]
MICTDTALIHEIEKYLFIHFESKLTMLSNLKPILNSDYKTGLLLLTLLFFIVSSSFAQQSYGEKRSKFYQISELIRLIEKAREAGFSEEDLRKMTINDANFSINVMEFIEKSRLKERLKKEKLDAFKKKKFLTIIDIFDELIVMEPEVLGKLREELVSD